VATVRDVRRKRRRSTDENEDDNTEGGETREGAAASGQRENAPQEGEEPGPHPPAGTTTEDDTGSEDDSDPDDEEGTFVAEIGTSSDLSHDEDEASSEDYDPPHYFRRSRDPSALEKEVPLVAPRKKYTGHANSQTVKDVNFGFQDKFVMTGSDDGNLFVFEKESEELKGIFWGDSSGAPFVPSRQLCDKTEVVGCSCKRHAASS
jgi:hypothetical protein